MRIKIHIENRLFYLFVKVFFLDSRIVRKKKKKKKTAKRKFSIDAMKYFNLLVLLCKKPDDRGMTNNISRLAIEMEKILNRKKCKKKAKNAMRLREDG